jgi:hypothetical protein
MALQGGQCFRAIPGAATRDVAPAAGPAPRCALPIVERRARGLAGPTASPSQRAASMSVRTRAGPARLDPTKYYFREPSPWPLDIALAPHDLAELPYVDLVVAGAGPSGVAVAERVAAAGFTVCVVDPTPHAPWPNNYGAWVDEFQAMGLEDCMEVIWPKAKVWLDNGKAGEKWVAGIGGMGRGAPPPPPGPRPCGARALHTHTHVLVCRAQQRSGPCRRPMGTAAATARAQGCSGGRRGRRSGGTHMRSSLWRGPADKHRAHHHHPSLARSQVPAQALWPRRPAQAEAQAV